MYQGKRRSPMDPKPLPFVYEPLNYTGGFIRVLNFLPNLSETGLLQCQIRHVNTKSRYTCLSYTWGPEGDEYDILVNGRIARVRKNLRDFMEVARRKFSASSRAFWIDAICINQMCGPEKTHQVSQMSRIYPGAEEVIGWLGFSERIERAVAFWSELNTLEPATYHDTNNIWHKHINNRNKELGKDWNKLAEQEYWRRAWITQEILLARKFKLLVGESDIEPKSIPGIAHLLPDRSSSSSRKTSELISTQIFHTYLEHLCGSNKMMDTNLISLLRMLPRDSTNPRDLIISLLSVAQVSDSINIARDKSNQDMLLDLMAIFAESLCPCVTSYLTKALELKINLEIFANSTQEISLFSISLKAAYFQPTFPLDPDKQIEYCTQCGCKGTDLGTEWTSLCTDSFSGCTHGCHLYLSCKHIADGESKHVVKTGLKETEFEVEFVEETELENNDWGYSLYFTVDVLINLFHALRSTSWEAGSICMGPPTSGTYPRIKRVYGSAIGCALQPCREHGSYMTTMAGSKLLELPTHTSDLVRPRQQLATWSTASTVERFLEDPAPWVPGYVRSSLPHAAFSDLVID